MLVICAVYGIAYISNLKKHGTYLKFAHSVFVVTSYVNTMMLSSERR